MNKLELLNYLSCVPDVGVADISASLGVHRATASMALLRLSRQGLARRFRYDDTPELRYRISDRGMARLDYLLNAPAQ